MPKGKTTFLLKLSTDERKRYQAKAEASRMTLSAWMRLALDNAPTYTTTHSPRGGK